MKEDSLLRVSVPLNHEVTGRERIGLKDNGYCFNALSSRAEPGAETGAVRSSRMARVRGCMGNAGHSHVPVHQNETDQQGPDKAGGFQSSHDSLSSAQHSIAQPILSLLFRLLGRFHNLKRSGKTEDKTRPLRKIVIRIAGNWNLRIEIDRRRLGP